MNKKFKQKLTTLSCVCLLAISLVGCVEPADTHEHIEQTVEVENVTGYAWERNNYRLWHNVNLLGADVQGTYVGINTKFRETASFLVTHTVDGIEQKGFISFDIEDVDTYASIMSHLYELFDIQIEHITYTDGCTTKRFKLIGLHEELNK